MFKKEYIHDIVRRHLHQQMTQERKLKTDVVAILELRIGLLASLIFLVKRLLRISIIIVNMKVKYVLQMTFTVQI